jgi:uncharacterized damage-inducible protein DinB
MSSNARQAFLDAYEREHAITMKVLHAYPADKKDLRPHPKSKTARELAWIFVLERGLGKAVANDAFASAPPSGKPPETPESWEEILNKLEETHKDFGKFVKELPEERLRGTSKFFVGPNKLADTPLMDFLWFLLHDQIHHRGQMSIYLRMADGKVPSIYGPSGDEPWF